MSRRMVKQLNQTIVAPEVLGDVMEAIAARPADDRGFEGATFAAVAVCSQLGLPVKERVAMAQAVTFRLAALARLSVAQPLSGFTQPGRDGAEWLHVDVIRCAAESPLVLAGDDIEFDQEAFRERLLAISTVAGSA